MNETRNMVCIVCPLGCGIKVTLAEGGIEGISGNRCNRGADYAETECVNPVRMLTSTARVSGGRPAVVSVRSDRPLPKGLVPECMEQVSRLCLQPPVHIGDVVIGNICDTGTNIIATKNIL